MSYTTNKIHKGKQINCNNSMTWNSTLHSLWAWKIVVTIMNLELFMQKFTSYVIKLVSKSFSKRLWLIVKMDKWMVGASSWEHFPYISDKIYQNNDRKYSKFGRSVKHSYFSLRIYWIFLAFRPSFDFVCVFHGALKDMA